MRKVSFAGTPMGLTWSPAGDGFIRSDGLITEIPVDQLVRDEAAAAPFADLATAGVKSVLLAPPTCDPSILRVAERYAERVGIRAVAHACSVPPAGTGDLDLLVERLRTVQDIVPVPVVMDPMVSPTQDPAEVARALRELCERVWCTFVLDLTSLQEFATGRGITAERVIANLPPSRVAYVRVRSSTARPVSSSTRDLVMSTMSRWDENPPAIVLTSDRPVSMQVRELGDLMALSGHLTDPSDWPRADMMASPRLPRGRTEQDHS